MAAKVFYFDRSNDSNYMFKITNQLKKFGCLKRNSQDKCLCIWEIDITLVDMAAMVIHRLFSIQDFDEGRIKEICLAAVLLSIKMCLRANLESQTELIHELLDPYKVQVYLDPSTLLMELEGYDYGTVKEIMQYNSIKESTLLAEDEIVQSLGSWILSATNPHHLIEDWLNSHEFPNKVKDHAFKICNVILQNTCISLKYSSMAISMYCIKLALSDYMYGSFKLLLGSKEQQEEGQSFKTQQELGQFNQDEAIKGLNIQGLKNDPDHNLLRDFLGLSSHCTQEKGALDLQLVFGKL